MIFKGVIIMNKLYTVVRDTREKEGHGWMFSPCDWCNGTVIEALPTGDYTLKGLENIFVIERKANTSEFSRNILEARFIKELERLQEFEFPYVVLEFNMDDILNFPENSGIPKMYWKSLAKISPRLILAKLMEFQLKYKTKFILAGSGNGHRIASCLMKRMVELVNEREKERPATKPRRNKK
jgi:hypothetical protein